jgi:hypothetical protein
MGNMRNAYKIVIEKIDDYVCDVDADGSIILDLKEIGSKNVDWIQGYIAGSCKHVNEASGDIKPGFSSLAERPSAFQGLCSMM